MKDTLRSLMLNVVRLTRSGRLRDAKSAIQQALGGAHRAGPGPASNFPGSRAEAGIRCADGLEVPTQEGEFLYGSFSHASESRSYKLYLPPSSSTHALPLVVMLHGCKQNPDDFAAGTGMNRLAQTRPCLVLYPQQDLSANASGCWNWFKQADQQRGRGEPALIAGMTREVMALHHVDARRVYIAGLSAGGAMAAIMAATYPELYAAAGIHSGLPYAAATDLMSAMAAMRQGPGRAVAAPPRRVVPTIVFHGDRDTTVHPRNGDEVFAQAHCVCDCSAHGGLAAGGGVSVEQGAVPGGHAYTRTVHRDAQGLCDAEQWIVHGAAHAWSGGQAAGSYTDPQGPDASREMLRFFAEHPMPG